MAGEQARAWVLHVDLDQFIAAVEIARAPHLRGLPVVVGGRGDPQERGVVATASYEARAFGVHSGVPLRTAARRCPQAVFLPVDKPAYEAVSARVMTALRGLGAPVEVLGWDEAYLAATTGEPEALAARARAAVTAATGLECTVGIGENRLQAKTATGYGKPAGVFTLTHATWLAVLGGEPVSALHGIGARTAAKLAGFGISTVSQLASAGVAALAARFGPVTGPWLVATARGLDSAEVSADPWVPRSRGREVTFQHDIEDWEQVRAAVVSLAGQVSADVAADGREPARVVVKVRYRPFRTLTHGVPVPAPDPGADAGPGRPAQLEQGALAAPALFTDRAPVRLLGVRAEFGAAAAR